MYAYEYTYTPSGGSSGGGGGGKHLVAGTLVDEFDRRHFSLGFPKVKKKVNDSRRPRPPVMENNDS
jgi:hypothetical protein